MDGTHPTPVDDPMEQAVLGASPIDATPEPEPSVRRFDAATYVLIALLGAMSAIGPLAIDMYLPSFPAIAREMGTNVAGIEQTLAAYFIGLSLGQLFYGPLADRFGRKAPLYLGLGVFAAASIGCALAGSVAALSALRFLQALGGCAQMVIARAIVRDRFDERDAVRVFSALILVMGVAPILAPLLGGWFVVYLGWRSIFWFLAAFAAACFVVVALWLPESLPPQRRKRERPAETLRVYASLLRERTFLTSTLVGSLASAGLFAYISGSAFVFIELFHVPAEHFGWFFGANAMGLIVASQVNGALVRRIEPRRLLQVSLAVAAAAGATLLLTAGAGVGGFAGVIGPLFVFVASLGFVMPNATAIAMAPHGEHAGNASALFGCLQFLLSGAGGLLVSAMHNDTAVPMAGLIAAAAVGALVIHALFVPAQQVEAVAA